VGTILKGVSLPLNAIWSQGISAGQKYFNITTQAPQTANAAQGAPGAQSPQGSPQFLTGQGQGVPAQQQSQQQLSGVAPEQTQQVSATETPAETESTTEEDDEEDSDSDLTKII
jgi:hypothetical protein